MKKIFFAILFIFVIKLSAQDFTIICTNQGENCTLPNPDVDIFYTIVPSSGWTVFSDSWDAGSSTEINSKGPGPIPATPVFRVNWKNKDNNPGVSKTVTANVTLRRPRPNTNPVEYVYSANITRILPIKVKHIAPVTSMSISTGVPSTITTNLGSTSTPCGTAPITFSVPTPFTDPTQSVIYTWSFPSGWSGSSSSNTIILTPDANSTGTVSVVAKRTDGTVTQSFSVFASRDVVQNNVALIDYSGGNFCSGDSKVFGFTATNATTYQLSASGTFSLGFTFGNLGLFNINGNGTGFVTVTANNACNVPVTQTFNFTTGTPVLSSVSVNGYPNSYINYINNPGYLVANISNNGPSTSPSFNWTIDGGNGVLYPNSGGSGVTYNGVTYNHGSAASAYAYDFVRVKVATANVCGEGGSAYMNLQDVSNMYRMASPNPAQNQIAVDLSKNMPPEILKSITLVSDAVSSTVRTYTQGGTSDRFSQRRDNRVTLDVSSLPRGKYFLILLFAGDKKFSEQIVLN
jgi:hypothetical protein